MRRYTFRVAVEVDPEKWAEVYAYAEIAPDLRDDVRRTLWVMIDGGSEASEAGALNVLDVR